MIDAPHLNELVMYFNMAAVRPGPFAAKIISINSDGSIDLEVFKDDQRLKELNVMRRNMAESGRMWDFRKDRADLAQ